MPELVIEKPIMDQKIHATLPFLLPRLVEPAKFCNGRKRDTTNKLGGRINVPRTFHHPVAATAPEGPDYQAPKTDVWTGFIAVLFPDIIVNTAHATVACTKCQFAHSASFGILFVDTAMRRIVPTQEADQSCLGQESAEGDTAIFVVGTG